MLLEELGDLVLIFRRAEPGAAVPAALDDDQLARHTGLLQRFVKQLTLSERHKRVRIAVQNQKRRSVLRDVYDGVGLRRFLLVLLNRAADQSRLRRLRAVVVDLAVEIGRASCRESG